MGSADGALRDACAPGPAVTIDRVELLAVRMPLRAGFETSFGRVGHREPVIVRVRAGGLTGYGEAPVASRPHYSAETQKTALSVLADWLAPAVCGRTFAAPREIGEAVAFCRGHRMAKAALEWAFWDVWAQARGISLGAALGAVRDRVPVGVSLGIPAGAPADRAGGLVDTVARRLDEGYGRVKVKVAPGFCARGVRAVRERFPALRLAADANGAFRLSDVEALRALDPFDLLYLEQPLQAYDLTDHARLRRELRTPLCLDESVEGTSDLDAAIALESLDILNVKPGRVGGPSTALALARRCHALDIPAWCGGMLETGIGRAGCVALAATEGFTLEADLSASDRYYQPDLVEPAFALEAGSTLRVPSGVGLGVEVQEDRLAAVTVARVEVSAG